MYNLDFNNFNYIKYMQVFKNHYEIDIDQIRKLVVVNKINTLHLTHI